MKNAVFMIIGGIFVVFCLLSYLGPRTLEAFMDPPLAPALGIPKYVKPGDYTLDQSATVIYREKRSDNVQLPKFRDLFRFPNVVEAMTDCGEFGCCENLDIAKSDASGNNCNGFLTVGEGTPPNPPPYPLNSPPNPPPYPLNSPPPYPLNSPPYPPPHPPHPMPPPYGSTDTVFIAPPNILPPNEMRVGYPKQFRPRRRYGCKKPQPCPPCARCPEPSFDCKKVPNYGSSNSEYLPMPILNDFSTFGM